MTGRKLIAVFAVGACVVAGWIAFNPASLLDRADAEVPGPRNTAEVRVGDITASFSADGTIGPAEEWDLIAAGPGTITSVAAAGSVLTTGFEVVAIDARPIIAVVGDGPAWRTMTVDDEGPDVLAVERALVELGYDTAGQLTVDGYYTEYTGDLVEAWQLDQGRPVTGAVALGDIVIAPDGARISSVSVTPGAQASGDLMRFSSGSNTVTFEVDAGERATLAIGDSVQVRFEDRSEVAAVVDSIGSSGAGTWLVSTGEVPLEASTGPLASDIEVLWARQMGTDLTLVNGNALVRLDDGSYALEVVGASDRDTEFVPVELGVRSGSTVAVTGVDPGTLIVVP